MANHWRYLVFGCCAFAARLGWGDPPLDLAGDPLPAGVALRLGTARFHCDGGLTCLAISPDGAVVAGGGDTGAVVFWDAATGRVLRRSATASLCRSLAFSPDGRWIAVGSRSSGNGDPVYAPLIRQWLLRMPGLNGEAPDVAQEVLAVVVRKLPAFERQREGSFRCWLRAITANQVRDCWKRRQRQPQAGLGEEDHDFIAQLWWGSQLFFKTLAGQKVNLIKDFKNGGGAVASIAYSHDGLLFAAGQDDGTIRLWNVAQMQKLPAIGLGDGHNVYSLAFGRADVDRKRKSATYLLAAGGQDGTVRTFRAIFNQANGGQWSFRQTDTKFPKAGPVIGLRFSPDGSAGLLCCTRQIAVPAAG